MGRISYYTAAIKRINENKDFEFVLKTENEEIKYKAGMIVVLNVYYAGSSLVSVESVNIQYYFFDIFIIYDAGIFLLLKYLTQKENFEQQVTESEVKHIQAKDIMIETKKQMSLVTNGEVYLQTPIKINVVNKKIEFIVG